MASSSPKKSDQYQPDPSQALPGQQVETAPAQPLAQGYEYVDAETAPSARTLDTEDDSLTFRLMEGGEVLEKYSRQEKRAMRQAAKAHAAHQRALEEEAEARALALEEEAARRAGLPPAKDYSSRLLILASALGSATLLGALGFALLSSQTKSQEPAGQVQPPAASATASASPSASKLREPSPSFNTQPPTVTGLDQATPQAPGTVYYAPEPTPQPLEPSLAPEPSFSPQASPEPTPTPEATLTPEPSETPTAEVSPTPEPSETPTLEPSPSAEPGPSLEPSPSISPEPSISAEPSVSASNMPASGQESQQTPSLSPSPSAGSAAEPESLPQ